MADMKKWRKIAKKHPVLYCRSYGTCKSKYINEEEMGVYQVRCCNRGLCTVQTEIPQRIIIPSNEKLKMAWIRER